MDWLDEIKQRTRELRADGAKAALFEVDDVIELVAEIDNLTRWVERQAAEIARMKSERARAMNALFAHGWEDEDAENIGSIVEGVCETTEKDIATIERQAVTIAKARAALEMIEWVFPWIGTKEPSLTEPNVKTMGFYKCPWCNQNEGDGHAPDCQRQAALAQMPEPPESQSATFRE